MKATIRNLFLLTFILLTTFVSCSEKEIDKKRNYSNDLESFDKSLEIFTKANRFAVEIIENSKKGAQFDTSFVTNKYHQYIETISEGIIKSENISDDFLDYLHPELKSMYREKFVGSYKMIIEFVENGDYNNAEEFDQKIYDMQQSFHVFLLDKQIDFNKISDGGNKPKKSYWRMLLRFLISNFATITIFSLLLFTIFAPLMFIGLLADDFNKSFSTVLSLLFLAISVVCQIYFWVLWASYCAYTVKYYIYSPVITYNWIYYLTGFFMVSAPISWFGRKESHGQYYNNRNSTQIAVVLYCLIAIICYIVFCIWSNLLDYKYISWVNYWLY